MNATPLPGTSTNLRPGMQSNTNQQRLGVGVQRQQQSRCKANVSYRFIVKVFNTPQHHYNQAVLEPGQMKPQQTHLVILS